MADWTPQEDAELRNWWFAVNPDSKEGTFSAAEIGQLMGGRSKNSIVGRVHRLDLPARPSPIIYRGGRQGAHNPNRVPAYRMKPPPLPPLPSEITEIVADVFDPPKPAIVSRPPPPPPAPVIIPRFRRPSHDACCYPTGTSPRIRFECEALAMPGKPYCVAHSRICFVNVRHRNPEGEYSGAEIEEGRPAGQP